MDASLHPADLSTAENWRTGSLGFSEEDAVLMETLRKLSSAMLRQAAADMSSEVDLGELQTLRDAAEHGDKTAEKRHDVLQERLHYRRTAQQWLEHWQDASFDLPFELCARATWPACEPEQIAKMILEQPVQYLDFARQQKDYTEGSRATPRPPRH